MQVREAKLQSADRYVFNHTHTHTHIQTRNWTPDQGKLEMELHPGQLKPFSLFSNLCCSLNIDLFFSYQNSFLNWHKKNSHNGSPVFYLPTTEERPLCISECLKFSQLALWTHLDLVSSLIHQLCLVDGLPQWALCLLSLTIGVGSYKGMANPHSNHVDWLRCILGKIVKEHQIVILGGKYSKYSFETFSLKSKQLILGPATLTLLTQGYFSSIP